MTKTGFRQIDNDTFGILIAAGLSGAGYQVVLTIIDRTLGFRKGSGYKEKAGIPLTYFKQVTGLSRQSVRLAVKQAEKRRIIIVERDSTRASIYALNPNTEEWLTRKQNHPSELGNNITQDWETKSPQTRKLAIASCMPAKETLKETLKEREPHPIDIFDESITPHPRETRLKASSTSLEAIAVRDLSHQDKNHPLEDTQTAKIVSYLQDNGSLSPQELSIALGVPTQTVRVILSRAKKQGIVANVERGKWAAVDGQKPPQNITQSLPFRIPVRVGVK